MKIESRPRFWWQQSYNTKPLSWRQHTPTACLYVDDKKYWGKSVQWSLTRKHCFMNLRITPPTMGGGLKCTKYQTWKNPRNGNRKHDYERGSCRQFMWNQQLPKQCQRASLQLYYQNLAKLSTWKVPVYQVPREANRQLLWTRASKAEVDIKPVLRHRNSPEFGAVQFKHHSWFKDWQKAPRKLKLGSRIVTRKCRMHVKVVTARPSPTSRVLTNYYRNISDYTHNQKFQWSVKSPASIGLEKTHLGVLKTETSR